MKWHPNPVLLPGKSHGQRNLVGCSPWGREESDTTEWLHFYFSLSCIGEGNGYPLQCSCLENPRDGGAWWAAIYGVAQSQTRLKWLSSSSRYFVFLPAQVPHPPHCALATLAYSVCLRTFALTVLPAGILFPTYSHVLVSRFLQGSAQSHQINRDLLWPPCIKLTLHCFPLPDLHHFPSKYFCYLACDKLICFVCFISFHRQGRLLIIVHPGHTNKYWMN